MKRLSSLKKPRPDGVKPGSKKDIPAGYDQSRFPTVAVTVDTVVLTEIKNEAHVLLIRRKNRPYQGFWALPGGFLDPGEDLDQAAARELKEETGLDLKRDKKRVLHFDQLRSFGRPDRDPRVRTVTVAYLVVIDSEGLKFRAGDDAADAAFVPLRAALASRALACDHAEILERAIDRVLDFQVKGA